MKLPTDVSVWPMFWQMLYEEHVFVLQISGISEEQAKTEAGAEKRRLAESEPERQSDEEREQRYAAILELEEIRSIRDRGRFKAAHPSALW